MHNLQTEEYMKQMDNNIDDKSKMISFITGNSVLDAGCGGGELTLRLKNLFYDAYGMDLSMLSYKELQKKGLGDKFIHGDLIEMDKHFAEGDIDTIIFSSVLHEVFSYTGFVMENVEKVLENALNIIPAGGRIIIRDGVKSSRDEKRIIRFKHKEDVMFLDEYCHRFEGRTVSYEKIDSLTYKMDVNDAMEFLYTYTWGWESFNREVQEQFGVMSMSEYVDMIDRLGGKVIYSHEYLQEGYNNHLLNKIEFYDESMNVKPLPNSTMLLVIEK